MTIEKLIVCRHKAAVEFIHRELPEFRGAPIIDGDASPEDVRGKSVAGVLPMHLAALTREFHAVEFPGRPPRGREYGLKEMDEAGARISTYKVLTGSYNEVLTYLVNNGFTGVL